MIPTINDEIWHGPRDSQGQFINDIKMSVCRSVHPSDERKWMKSADEVVASDVPPRYLLVVPWVTPGPFIVFIVTLLLFISAIWSVNQLPTITWVMFLQTNGPLGRISVFWFARKKGKITRSDSKLGAQFSHDKT